MNSIDETISIVIDIGSLKSKAGFSGDTVPKYVISSQMGITQQQPQNENQGSNQPENDQIIMQEENPDKNQKLNIFGDKNFMKDPQMQIENVYKNGDIINWEGYEKLLEELYDNQLKIQSKDHPLLMAEFSIHNQKQREKLCQLIFEKFNVPQYFVSKNAALSSFSAGRSTSVVVDLGAYCSMAVPVHDGYIHQKNILKFDIGGEQVTEKILQLENFPQQKLSCNSTESYERYQRHLLARNLKENNTNVLPDGTQLNIDQNEICDFFFNPHNEILRFKGIHQMVLDCINMWESELRKQMSSNVILAGGNALLFDLEKRFQNKLGEICNKVKYVYYPTVDDRKNSVWIGGSILTSLNSFNQLSISKQEYNDNGEFIIEKKCP
ncbi:hypothetical protein IMG5_138980 [Ichthyophthirius multifiliis]|uniref:Actin n=1 Tax=Ichthyophthirius multifiliis TaxID=5932 RepID=G0QX77_ICHMU|nr:hypothetical protein IMG5_138980 [Ichthyophthirius multifiliis]EGR30179.1 hypothetical protein IMG5_138980 [Ichthyophthirius multifiliis]|eukprot:XP_004031415.1 hypothetical protein IMG5_138980 [Ichthyophthirius multifiliis]